MFSFFRHHSWILIATLSLTIISFVVFMGKAPLRSGGVAGGDYGTIYGQVVTTSQYEEAKRTFFIRYWEQTGEWPDKNSQITPLDLEQQVYTYVIIGMKAKELGIHVSDDAAATAANDVLSSPSLMRMFGTTQPVPAAAFVSQVLAPAGLSAADFEQSVRSQVIVNQLSGLLGLSGALITPQEVSSLYDREYQEVSAQAVFFSYSNYLSDATIPPAIMGEFYTNNMAAYREPDRVQVNYVEFGASNFLAQAKAEWEKTNFEETVSAIYDRYATTEFADEKTPEAAKAKIREMMIHRRALEDATVQANGFVSTLYAMTPVQADNLTSLARKQNLPVYTSPPFGEDGSTSDFDAPPELTKAAFQLNADSPYTGPIASSDAVFVIALARQLPSEIPSLDSIHDRVEQDMRTDEAIGEAQRAGTNFDYYARVEVPIGQKFTKVAGDYHVGVVTLAPFSLNTTEVPELGGHGEISQLRQAAFTTAPGKVSAFVPTDDGGFVVYVKSLLPVDQTKKADDLPTFKAALRRQRINEAFTLWLSNEMNRELRNTPFYKEQQANENR